MRVPAKIMIAVVMVRTMTMEVVLLTMMIMMLTGLVGLGIVMMLPLVNSRNRGMTKVVVSTCRYHHCYLRPDLL